MRTRFIAPIVLVVGTLSCSSPTEPAAVATVTVTPNTITLASGATTTLTAAVLDAKGAALSGRVITWTSSDATLASISPDGTVRAGYNRAGNPANLTITATSEGKTGTAVVAVTPVPVSKVIIAPDSLVIEPNATATLTIAIQDTSGAVLSGRSVTWISLDTAIARVTVGGQVQALPYNGPDKRETKVIASSENKADTARVVVLALAAAAIEITARTNTLESDDTLQLSASTKAKDSTVLIGKQVTWATSNATLATITSTGLVQSGSNLENSSSMVAITASVDGISRSINLVIKPIRAVIPAANIDLFPNLNWNDVVSGKTNYYDFNKDGVPDVVAMEAAVGINPAVFTINDVLGRQLYRFDLKQYKPTVRDSLRYVGSSAADFDGDGDLDLVLNYNGEWPKSQNNPSDLEYIGSNVYLLINKGSMTFDVKEIFDDRRTIYFQQDLFDWDFDGLVDLAIAPLESGKYFKNLGNNVFEERAIATQIKSSINVQGVDYDRDGRADYVGLWVPQTGDCDKPVYGEQVLYIANRTGVQSIPVTGKQIRKNVYNCLNSESYERINLVDGDGDGDLDLVVGYFVLGATWAPTQKYEYFENRQTEFVYRQNFIDIPDAALYQQFLQAYVTDINGDGRQDLYYGTYSKSRMNGIGWRVFWWENTGTGFRINQKFRLIY